MQNGLAKNNLIYYFNRRFFLSQLDFKQKMQLQDVLFIKYIYIVTFVRKTHS